MKVKIFACSFMVRLYITHDLGWKVSVAAKQPDDMTRKLFYHSAYVQIKRQKTQRAKRTRCVWKADRGCDPAIWQWCQRTVVLAWCLPQIYRSLLKFKPVTFCYVLNCNVTPQFCFYIAFRNSCEWCLIKLTHVWLLLVWTDGCKLTLGLQQVHSWFFFFFFFLIKGYHSLPFLLWTIKLCVLFYQANLLVLALYMKHIASAFQSYLSFSSELSLNAISDAIKSLISGLQRVQYIWSLTEKRGDSN